MSMNSVELYGKAYVKMTPEELDDFCQWIYMNERIKFPW